MAKEFLLNQNNVAYTTAIGGSKFEPNRSGVKLRDINYSNFAFRVAIKNITPEYPRPRLAQAIPNKSIKEKYIEKTFYVTVPVKAQKSDLDLFLDRISKFQNEFKEDIKYSLKAISKIKKGETFGYKGRDGQFILEFGEKTGGSVDFKGAEGKGNIEAVILRGAIISPKKQNKEIKNARPDSRGNKFSFSDSPKEDVEEVISEMLRSEVRTVCRSDKFKVTIKDLIKGSLRDLNEGPARKFNCDIICNFIDV